MTLCLFNLVARLNGLNFSFCGRDVTWCGGRVAFSDLFAGNRSGVKSPTSWDKLSSFLLFFGYPSKDWRSWSAWTSVDFYPSSSNQWESSDEKRKLQWHESLEPVSFNYLQPLRRVTLESINNRHGLVHRLDSCRDIKLVFSWGFNFFKASLIAWQRKKHC